MIKISVIVPVYNMKKYLGECLDSIINQSLQELEIIAINDGSVDDSLSILEKYALKDPRIRIINKNNEGVGAARNDGMKAARGEFVAFMDSDDKYADNDALLRCFEAAQREGVRVAGGGILYLHEDGTLKEEETVKIGAESITVRGLLDYRDYQYDYGYWRFIYQLQMLIENNIYFPTYSRFQDPPFFVKAMISAGEFYLMDKPVYVYRQLYGESKHSANKTLDFLKGIMENLKISRENGLAKLHYITAHRLKKEGSFMVTKNLFDKNRDELLFNMIKASSMVDSEWLKDSGYPDAYPFVPEVFEYLASTTEKYEKLRSNKFLQGLNKATKSFRRKKYEPD